MGARPGPRPAPAGAGCCASTAIPVSASVKANTRIRIESLSLNVGSHYMPDCYMGAAFRPGCIHTGMKLLILFHPGAHVADGRPSHAPLRESEAAHIPNREGGRGPQRPNDEERLPPQRCFRIYRMVCFVRTRCPRTASFDRQPPATPFLARQPLSVDRPDLRRLPRLRCRSRPGAETRWRRRTWKNMQWQSTEAAKDKDRNRVAARIRAVPFSPSFLFRPAGTYPLLLWSAHHSTSQQLPRRHQFLKCARPRQPIAFHAAGFVCLTVSVRNMVC